MAESPGVQGTIRYPEVSGAEYLPGDRLLLASDEHGLRVVARASGQLRSGHVLPEPAGALGKKVAKDFPLEDVEDVRFDGRATLSRSSRPTGGTAGARRRRPATGSAASAWAPAASSRSPGIRTARWAILTELPPLAEASLRTPARGGLNVEGLAFDPRGHLLVGLRSPTVTRSAKRKSKAREDAVVLRVCKLDDLFGDDPDEPAELLGVPDWRGDGRADRYAADATLGDKAALLDLGGQGVRGLRYDRDRSACWVLSGLSADPNHDVAQPWGLWLWDGGGGDPRPVGLPAGVGLTGPEAICLVPVDREPHLLVVEDPGVPADLLGPNGEVDVGRLVAAGAGSRYVLLPVASLVAS